MKRSIVNGCLVIVLGLVVPVTGCASHYYKVTDPQSGSVYYTEEIDNVRSGAVKLNDARTRSIVTLQNSEVKEISKYEFFVGINTPMSNPTQTEVPASAPAATSVEAPSQAAPIPAPAPAPAAQPSSAPSGT